MYINLAQPFALPPYWQNNPEVVKRVDNNATAAAVLGVPHACPLRIKRADEAEWWQLPIEPVVAVSGKNTIVSRAIAKTTRRGTVKEYWNQDDYTISISGLFIADEFGELPENDIRTLRAYCETPEALEVESPLLTLFAITHIVIESYEFPFTKGMENQLFTINALSDDNFTLLEEQE